MFLVVTFFLIFSKTSSFQIGLIRNVSLIPSGRMINSTCEECICLMLNPKENIRSFNCIRSNLTCQLYTNYSTSISYEIQLNRNSLLYFIQLPTISTSTYTSVSSVVVTSIFWNFDNNTKDLYNVYHGTPTSVSYTSPGITGYGSALSLTYMTSYVTVSSPYVNLRNRSFTIDTWVYPGTTMYGNDYLILALCPSQTNYQCMQVMIRYGKPLLTLYYSDCLSPKNISISTWTHLAFVYNYVSNIIILYVNGYVDSICPSASPFQGSPTAPLYIGRISSLSMYYAGLIDQLSIVTRVKSASEILDLASLVVYYSFADESLLDHGPNGINGTGMNIDYTVGRVNEAVVFNTTPSYVQINNLVLFGMKSCPYTLAFWIYPYRTKNATLIHMWRPSAPTTYCIPILGFTSSGSIVAQTWNSTQILTITGPILSPHTWIHIAHTYSPNDGIRLFINGTLVANTHLPSANLSTSVPLNMALGHCVNASLCSCASGQIVPGQYYGLIDEFRLYSRLLNLTEIFTLANV